MNNRFMAVVSACFLATAVNFSTSGLALAGGDAASVIERLEGVKEGSRTINKLLGVNTRRVPWCGLTVGYAIARSGKKPASGHANARSWESWGRRVRHSAIKRGDVAVFRSKRARSGRHVAIVTAVKGNKVKVCSGNTRNQVFCSWRSKNQLSTVRR